LYELFEPKPTTNINQSIETIVNLSIFETQNQYIYINKKYHHLHVCCHLNASRIENHLRHQPSKSMYKKQMWTTNETRTL